MANTFFARTASLFMLLALPASVYAAEAPEFPTSPEQWVNSAPLSLESLKGKAVVLYYFEEECPRCRGKWPSRFEAAKKFEGQPVLFIAVNSGTPRPAINQYVKEVGLTWPVLLDFSREFEKKSGVGQISLQNIFQARVIDGQGKFLAGNPEDLEATATAALKTAHWRVEPAEIPPVLKPAWTAVEMANYPAAAKSIKSSLTSAKVDVKAAAEKLNAAVEVEMKQELKAAEQLTSGNKKWAAYKAYMQLADRYQGYSIPESVSQTRTELSGSDEVKPQLAAYKALEAAKKLVATDRSPNRIRATNALKKVAADHADTEAGAEAKQMLSGS